MATLFLIGDEETVLGFRFAGVRGHVAKEASEASELLQKAVRDEDVGIIVITERIAESIRPELESFTARQSHAFVVEIADSSGASPTRKSPSDIIREAIGISI